MRALDHGDGSPMAQPANALILTIAATVAQVTGAAAASVRCSHADSFPAGETGPTFPDQWSGMHEPVVGTVQRHGSRVHGDTCAKIEHR